MAPTLLLDLDGTLTDPAPGILAGVRTALTAMGRESPPDRDLLSVIGPPIRVSFRRLLGEDGDVEAGVRLYRAYVAERGLKEAAVYPGIFEALAELREAYAGRVFICTAKSQPFAEATADHFGLRPYLAGVYGAELGGRFEDKADLIAHMIPAEGIDPAHAVMVGDRSYDMIAARANGLTAIGALWGYGSEVELREAGAHALCAAPRDLPAALKA
ncbi:HAD hydrolase-like protein [Phenylobacterium sp.]|uniref:HAD hydrolase-like protein n=1 Tax=Phenylobacterium sp. TaxID=1871053 RepID=UPI003BACF01D